ncbi:MAG: hypothetical protein AB4058_08225 [Microcystaceae cyanobacterium]
MSDIPWSDSEKQAAHNVFKKAYEREIQSIMEDVKQKMAQITNVEELWQLHDFLSAKRHEIDGKYDYRYSMLVFVFAELLKEGWLSLEELQFLEKDKLAKITALARM